MADVLVCFGDSDKGEGDRTRVMPFEKADELGRGSSVERHVQERWVKNANWVRYRIQNPNRRVKKGGLRIGNVRKEGGIARRGAIGPGSLRSGNRRRSGGARRTGSRIEFTSMEKNRGVIGADRYLQNSRSSSERIKKYKPVKILTCPHTFLDNCGPKWKLQGLNQIAAPISDKRSAMSRHGCLELDYCCDCRSIIKPAVRRAHMRINRIGCIESCLAFVAPVAPAAARYVIASACLDYGDLAPWASL
jgi:hypothetical protein